MGFGTFREESVEFEGVYKIVCLPERAEKLIGGLRAAVIRGLCSSP